jgi:hypothetical protein
MAEAASEYKINHESRRRGWTKYNRSERGREMQAKNHKFHCDSLSKGYVTSYIKRQVFRAGVTTRPSKGLVIPEDAIMQATKLLSIQRAWKSINKEIVNE